MKFCQQCASPIILKVPDGDDKPRHCCSNCDSIFYQNPKNVVGTLPVYEDKVLLCRRAIEPRIGKWTLPAGYMENGESSLNGAIRETIEEAGAEIIVASDSLYTLYNLPKINQVYMFYRCDLDKGEFGVGPESLETELYLERDIPWDNIAFPVVHQTLKSFFRDVEDNHFPVQVSAIEYKHRRA